MNLLNHGINFRSMKANLKNTGTMKAFKKTLLLVAASFGTAAAFAQINVGAATNTQATVTKSVNAGAAANAATKATAATQGAAKGAVNAGASKAVEVKGAAVGATQAAAAKGVEAGTRAKGDVKNAADVKAGARVNAQASAHASEEARAHANENSAIFGAKADGNVQTQTGADVHVNGKKTLDATEEGATKVKTKVEQKGDATIEKTKKVKDGVKAKGKSEVHAGVKGAANASDEARAHANDNSAVIRAENETSASQDVRAGKSGAAADTKASSKTKVKVSKKG
jgi:hypothetical protein